MRYAQLTTAHVAAQRWMLNSKISPRGMGGDLFDYMGSTFGE